MPALVGMAVGTLLIALSYAGGRSGTAGAPVAFWSGQILAFVAAAALVVSDRASPRDRVTVVLALAAQQSFTRWMYSPLFFSADELQHWGTAQAILASHHLFHANPALPVSPVFPGLEEITTALVSLTHLGLFPAAIAVVSVAHVALAAAVFYLALRVTGSHRVAAIAAVLFAITPQQAGFNTQFIYEGPALLFFVVGLHAAVGGTRRSMAEIVPAVGCVAAVIVTHHVTAGVTLVVLAAIGILVKLERRDSVVANRLLWLFGLGSIAVAAWTLGVARVVFNYLAGPLSQAISGFVDAGSARGTDAVAASTGGLLDHGLSIGAALISAGLVAVGVAMIYSRRRVDRAQPLLRAFGLLSLGYFAILAMRLLASNGAEIATRLLTYGALFTAVVSAVVIAHLWGRRHLAIRAFCLLGMTAALLGGITSGWPATWELLPGRFQIDGFESGVDRQGTAAAKWFQQAVGPGQRVACDVSMCSLFAAYADANPVGDASGAYYEAQIDQSVVNTIKAKEVSYLVVDRRMSTRLPPTGKYFSVDPQAGRHATPVPIQNLEKFILPGFLRIYNSRWISIYDVRRVLYGN